MSTRPTHPYFGDSTPLAFAHRGFSLGGLENTMTAFSAAVDLGFRYLETDVHVTSDDVLVAFHDDTLDRVTDRSGAIAELPWSTVQQARIGGREPIPQLEDLLGTWSNVRLNIDVKTMRAAPALARAIERTRAHDRVCVASFSDARRRAVTQQLSAPVATSGGRQAVATLRFASWSRLGPLREVDCVQVPERHGRLQIVTPATIRAAHRMGKQIHVWTINEAADMHRLLDMGVDGIVTDRADIFRDVLRQRNLWSS